MTWSDLQKSVPRVQNVGIISVFFSPPIRSHPSLPFFQECLSWPRLRLLGAFTLSGDLFCVAPAGPQPFAPSSWCGDAGRLPVAFGSPRKPGQAHDSAQSHSGGKTKMTSHKGFPPFMSSSASGLLLGGTLCLPLPKSFTLVLPNTSLGISNEMAQVCKQQFLSRNKKIQQCF